MKQSSAKEFIMGNSAKFESAYVCIFRVRDVRFAGEKEGHDSATARRHYRALILHIT